MFDTSLPSPCAPLSALPSTASPENSSKSCDQLLYCHVISFSDTLKFSLGTRSISVTTFLFGLTRSSAHADFLWSGVYFLLQRDFAQRLVSDF